MVVSEHNEAIEGRVPFISTEIIDPEKAAEGSSIDNDGASLDEEDENGLQEAGVRTGVPELGTKEVEEVHQIVKYFSLLSYMMKSPSLPTQGFE